MKISPKYFSLLFFFVCGSCNNKYNSTDVPVIRTDKYIHQMQRIYLSDYTNNIRYVPLESNSDHLLADIMNMDIYENYILVSDGRSCLLYDTNGQFIRQIGKQGRGPGEYSLINYVSLINEKVYIHDILTSDLIEYDLNGTLKQRFKSGFTADDKYIMLDAIMLNDSLILGNIENRTGQEEYKALIINKQGNVKSYFNNYILFNLAPGVKSVKVPGKAIYFRFNKRVHFKELLNDTLFHVNENYQLIPTYVFNSGSYKESLSDRGKKWSQVDLSSYIYLNGIFPTDNFLILEYDFGKYFPAKRLTPETLNLPTGEYIQWYNITGKGVLGIYNKISGDLIFSEPTSTDNHLFTTGFYNDIDAGPRFFPSRMVNDSTMVMDIRFNQLTEHIASDDFKNNVPKYPEKKKELESFVNNLIDYDNPVLMFVTFKK
jgi:hypothetical protein